MQDMKKSERVNQKASTYPPTSIQSQQLIRIRTQNDTKRIVGITRSATLRPSKHVN